MEAIQNMERAHMNVRAPAILPPCSVEGCTRHFTSVLCVLGRGAAVCLVSIVQCVCVCVCAAVSCQLRSVVFDC